MGYLEDWPLPPIRARSPPPPGVLRDRRFLQAGWIVRPLVGASLTSPRVPLRSVLIVLEDHSRSNVGTRLQADPLAAAWLLEMLHTIHLKARVQNPRKLLPFHGGLPELDRVALPGLAFHPARVSYDLFLEGRLTRHQRTSATALQHPVGFG